MLAKAGDVQKETGVGNVRWREGSVDHLPFEDASFSLVVTRYSFHHLLNPIAALREMTRVCRPGGRVVVADATPAADKADAFNAYELMRDPSHCRALPLRELQALAEGLPLTLAQTVACDHDIDLETILKGSFPLPENVGRIRKMAHDDVGIDRLGQNSYRHNGEVRIRFPTTLIVWTRNSD
jgi:SAM-dependent methyltransferase